MNFEKKNLLGSLFAVAIFSLTIFGQTTAETGASEILQREKEWRTALIKADKKIEDIYAKNLVYNDWNGNTHKRTTLIADVLSGKLKYKTIQATKESEQVFLNTVIYTSELTLEGNYGTTPITRTVKLMHVWVKESGTWRLLVHQTQNIN